MDPKNSSSLEISIQTIARETGWKPSKCVRVLSRICSVSKIGMKEVREGYYSFLYPKYAEINNRWTKVGAQQSRNRAGEERREKREERRTRKACVLPTNVGNHLNTRHNQSNTKEEKVETKTESANADSGNKEKTVGTKLGEAFTLELEQLGLRFHRSAKSSAILKRVADTYGLDRGYELVDAFFKNDWVKANKAYTLQAFEAQCPSLEAKLVTKKKPEIKIVESLPDFSYKI